MAKRRYAGGVISATAPTGVQGMWDTDDQFRRQGAGTWPAQFNVDDVFSTYLYTGNGSTQTITNGIDLSTYGGMVWVKNRATTGWSHKLVDTARGLTDPSVMRTDQTTGAVNNAGAFTAFNSNGFSVAYADQTTGINVSGEPYSSWTFRKSPRFFDVVTYTGNGGTKTVSHSLGVTPGMIIVKRTDTTGDWPVYHRSDALCGFLNYTNGFASAQRFSSVTSTDFTINVSTADCNANNATYVAYLFAHDTATDGIIQAGSFTTDAGVNATVTLGYEPQYVMVKRSDAAENWLAFDQIRGLVVGGYDSQLSPNTSNPEYTLYDYIQPTSTGFKTSGANLSPNATYIYLAIRRSNKPPTDGTQVFQPTVYTGNNANNRLVDTTIAPDFVMVRQRNGDTSGMVTASRLTGQYYLLTGATNAEMINTNALDQQLVSATEYGTAFSSMNGFWVGNDLTPRLNYNTTSNNHIALAFKRAVGVFDEVCGNYMGTNNHALGVTPELIIGKQRNVGNNWFVWHKDFTISEFLYLEQSVAKQTLTNLWLTPSTTTFGFQGSDSNPAIFRLFATKPGISKVFSYTGTGSDLTIDCGFSTGARFVLIKATSMASSWFIWDSARGIVAGNDPTLYLEATTAESTAVDYIDPVNSGFTLTANGNWIAGFNKPGETYIGLAIS